ncbi:MAG: hypothetical protein FWG41_02675 [Methanomassiliicoccaceae archaeon]|nr:hypothetical protein [Methanomassiliicoccaceae archaeon]
MSEKGKRYTDPELEKFLKENKEMLERLFKEEKDMMQKLLKEEKEFFGDAFEEERKRAEEFAEKQKERAKDTAQEMFNAFTDPEVQRHFMAMGMEFMMAVSAMMKNMPFPDSVKDMADKAEQARKNAAKNGSGRSKPAQPEKIEIKPAQKKSPSSTKTKTSSSKESD